MKHVEFYSKNKFEKLTHLVGFIIRIYYKNIVLTRKHFGVILIVIYSTYFCICWYNNIH